MLSLLIGVLAAMAASTLYSLGIAVQAIDARVAGDQYALRISLLTQLLRRGRWLAGTAMTALGWPLQIIALLFAPLEVVQPALATGLLVLLLVGERMLGERPGRRELLSVSAIVAGVGGIAALAPARSTHQDHGIGLIVVLAALGFAALLPFIGQAIGRGMANLTMLGAGFAFAWGALATKLVADGASDGHWIKAAGWATAAIVASIVGLTAEMSALQKRAAILVAPVVFAAETFVPVVLAPAIWHESFIRTPLSGVPLLACLGVLIAGATILARSPALLAVSGRREAAQRASTENGSADNRSALSASATRSTARNARADPESVSTSTSPDRSERAES
jgi:drug/metabolite transporter (DMT)-like permease